jgi:galactoside O-acetyltransferase
MQNPFDPGYYASEELRSFGFGEVGENVQIARNCTIIGLPNISIGDNVRIDGNTSLVAPNGYLKLGSYIHIGGYCHLIAAEDLAIGDFSGVSQGARIYTATDDFSGKALMGPMVPAEYRELTKAPVEIGRYAVLGSGAVVLPGGSVPEGCAVGALSLVVKPLEPWGIYAGIPVRRLRNRSRALLEHEARLRAQDKDCTA